MSDAHDRARQARALDALLMKLDPRDHGLVFDVLAKAYDEGWRGGSASVQRDIDIELTPEAKAWIKDAWRRHESR